MGLLPRIAFMLFLYNGWASYHVFLSCWCYTVDGPLTTYFFLVIPIQWMGLLPRIFFLLFLYNGFKRNYCELVICCLLKSMRSGGLRGASSLDKSYHQTIVLITSWFNTRGKFEEQPNLD